MPYNTPAHHAAHNVLPDCYAMCVFVQSPPGRNAWRDLLAMCSFVQSALATLAIGDCIAKCSFVQSIARQGAAPCYCLAYAAIA